MKNVLVLVHHDAGQEARLQVALDVTRALSGHLYCLDVTPYPIVYDTFWGLGPAEVVDETEQEQGNKSEIQQRLAKEDVSWSWTDAEGDLGECLLGVAKSADVIVLNRRLDAMALPNASNLAARVLTHSEALVVAVGETCHAFDVTSPALIAWDGSEQAFGALRRATPLLGFAERVEVYQVGALPDAALPATEAAQYLSRHGIKAEIEFAAESDDPAEAIGLAAQRIRAGCCVMGAFGHSRIRETLFGGVTRRMLKTADIPLLMAH